MTKRNFPVPPAWHVDLAEWVRQIRDAVAGLMDGKHNASGSVTLTANAATTTLSDRRIHAESVITFMPTTANAAAEMDSLWVSARGDGSCTLNHANNAQSDRTLDYMLGGS